TAITRFKSSRLIRSKRGKCGTISNKPMTAKLSACSHSSHPAATIRGPAIPAKRAFGRRARIASMSCARRLSPEVSPATRTNSGREDCELDLGSYASIMHLRSSVTGAPSGTDLRFLPDTGVRRTRSSSNDSDPFPPRRGLVQEGYQGNELRLRFGAAFQLGNGLDQLASGPIKDLVRLANVSDLLRREAASLEPFDVHAVRLRRAADRHDVRRNVARDRS